MKIQPANIKDQETIMEKVRKWRKVPHDYEDPKPFKDDKGEMIQTLFCNKCGLSKQAPIHG